MVIKQFEDRHLSHYSYAVLSGKEIVLIDPSRNTRPYIKFAEEEQAKIIAVIETHSHADFVSSHLELHHSAGATIYASKFMGASYPHLTFDDGDEIVFGKIKLKAINTPGHSYDSICILLEHDGEDKAIFTGDTLFIGDCGRPDLRETQDDQSAPAELLAKQLFHSLRERLMVLNDEVLVYPAHGAGTLCGKALSKANSSTIAEEKRSNWCLQPMSEAKFVAELLDEQPFIPKYFSNDVELNKKGSPALAESIKNIPVYTEDKIAERNTALWLIDTRNHTQFNQGHFPGSINIMQSGKFETWLGSIISPDEKFCLAAENETHLMQMMERTASIGYESQIAACYTIKHGSVTNDLFNTGEFRSHQANYTIVDVRNRSEVKKHKIFHNSIAIPLGELRERIHEIPTDKPIAVHCSAGYRSAVGSSMLEGALSGRVKVFDVGETVKNFM